VSASRCCILTSHKPPPPQERKKKARVNVARWGNDASLITGDPINLKKSGAIVDLTKTLSETSDKSTPTPTPLKEPVKKIPQTVEIPTLPIREVSTKHVSKSSPRARLEPLGNLSPRAQIVAVKKTTNAVAIKLGGEKIDRWALGRWLTGNKKITPLYEPPPHKWF